MLGGIDRRRPTVSTCGVLFLMVVVGLDWTGPPPVTLSCSAARAKPLSFQGRVPSRGHCFLKHSKRDALRRPT